MEFYFSRHHRRDFLTYEFQFPTGWNSTKNTSKTANIDIVSIPNGMEFYQKVIFLLERMLKGFNSQRDGILQRYRRRARANLFVSIPNGMEFYYAPLLKDGSPACFNSQRDGILPNFSSTYYAEVAFQFPTGWNST